MIADPPLPAEKANLSGYVLDNENEETLIGATVLIKDTKLGAHTNKDGFFSISGIEPGKYTVLVYLNGYVQSENELIFERSKSLRQSFKLKMRSVEGKELTVEAERTSDKREILISRIDIPVKNLKQIRIAGESDIFRSLQYLPGILTSSQISSGLYVRGGSPDQNLVLLDGATVYNPSHLFGFFSTFNPDAVKDVELIKGGFPAKYGGRLSAVLDLTQKDGNKNKIEGIGSIGLISSRLSVEGPSPFGKGSWFIGGRRTYIDLVKLFIKNDPASPLPGFNFYDLNAKITQNLGSDDRIFLSGFMSADSLDFASRGTDLGMALKNKTAALRWNHIFSESLFTNVILSASNYYNLFNANQNNIIIMLNNSITDYTLKSTVDWFISDKANMKFGYEGSRYHFNYIETISKNDTASQSTPQNIANLPRELWDWTHAVFAQTDFNIDEVYFIQAGIRGNYWTGNNSFSFDPRFAVSWHINDKISLKGALGLYHQYLRLASQPDFSFFDTWMPSDNTVPNAQANHYILSLETVPADGYNLNYDVYYKTMNNVTEINQYATTAATDRDIFFIGNEISYGMEIFLQKKYGDFYGWFGYGLGFIEARFPDLNKGEMFRPKYDRRHDLKLVGQYVINDRWEVGGQFTFQTGQSYTAATSVTEIHQYGSERQILMIVPSQTNGLRLPPSHQLNLNANYSFLIWGQKAKLYMDIFNVYSRRDIWFRFYNTRVTPITVEDVKLLPILPSVSIEVKF
ncbi:MAG: TonB-dependent receptor [Candidatus Kapabacteria bacterium]|nr:TonB-dependent receptor [Candidatus Kapabacteria bacterium]